LSTEHIQDTR